MIYAGASVLILLITVLILLLRAPRRPPPDNGPARPRVTASKLRPARLPEPKRCLLCGEYFAPGDTLQTSLYPDTGTGRLMEIAGCGRCAPEKTGAGRQLKRRCPLCGAVIAEDEVIMARRVEKPGLRPQLTILGCRRCFKPVRG
ncbi:MAG: hypothetical protein LBQ61_02770 [Spirochaetales bacterium]|nr:hypothetical protein [Spirochaetales bacterium]